MCYFCCCRSHLLSSSSLFRYSKKTVEFRKSDDLRKRKLYLSVWSFCYHSLPVNLLCLSPSSFFLIHNFWCIIFFCSSSVIFFLYKKLSVICILKKNYLFTFKTFKLKFFSLFLKKLFFAYVITDLFYLFFNKQI